MMVRAVPEAVVTTIAAVAVDLPVALAAPMMPALVLAMTVSVPVLEASLASAGKPALAPATAFAVDVAPAAPVLPSPEPMTPVALPVAPSATAAGPSLSNVMV